MQITRRLIAPAPPVRWCASTLCVAALALAALPDARAADTTAARQLERFSADATGLATAALAAWADGGARMPQHVPPAYTQECASCHTAYPPGLLPARSWQRVMSGLDKHYGTDASLDARTLQQISTWLQAHAATTRRVAEEPPQDRITRSAWFERKHRDVDPAVWKLPGVKTPANCAACHAGADHGRFDEHDLRLPAGLDARQRRAWND